jgi:acyl carrier protein
VQDRGEENEESEEEAHGEEHPTGTGTIPSMAAGVYLVLVRSALDGRVCDRLRAMSEAGRDFLVQKVVAAIAAMQKKPSDMVTLESTFAELGIDSLNGFHLLCELEEELGISIPDDDAREMRSVKDVIDRIRPLVAAKPS